MAAALAITFESRLRLYKVKSENKHERVFPDTLCAYDAHKHVRCWRIREFPRVEGIMKTKCLPHMLLNWAVDKGFVSEEKYIRRTLIYAVSCLVFIRASYQFT